MRRDSNRGSITAEAVILVPALVCLVSLIVYAGRLTEAAGSLQRAVDAGARAASLSSAPRMSSNGSAMAMSQLAQASSGCVASRASVSNTSVGRFRAVTVRARCSVNRSGLGFLVLPRVVLSAESTEVIDFYTQR